jgi:hypothetical protein
VSPARRTLEASFAALTETLMRRPLPAILLLASILVHGLVLSAATPSFWRVTTQAEFLAGEAESIAIDADGRVTLGPVLTPQGDPESPALWRAVIVDGIVFAGSGSDGKVFRFGADGKAQVFFDAEELQVHALAAAPGGGLYVGTSPDGKVYRVAADGTHGVVFDPEERYIWALATTPDRTLYVATGEKGAVYKVGPGGESAKFYTAKATHVTTLAVDGTGAVLAGTDSPGQVLKLDARGKAFVLLDSAFREIRALRFDDAGNLLVAAMNGRAASEPRAVLPSPVGEPQPTGAAPVPTVTTEVVITGIGDAAVQAAPSSGARAADTKREVRAAVLRIAPDGLWDTLWESSEDLPYDIVPDGGSVIVATGNKGRIFRVGTDVPSVTLIGQVPAQQVTGLIAAGANWMLATANPGKLFRLGAANGTRGTLTSDVFDASTSATWGALRWAAATPGAATVEVQTRSGNTSRPDDTWSDWSAAQRRAEGGPIASPKARYLQWRATLAGKDGESPVLTSVVAAYLPRNIRPEVKSITVHPPGTVFLRPYSSGEFEIAGFDAGTSDGRNLTSVAAVAPVQTQPALGRKTFQKGLQAFVWKAEDGNEDKLQYDVYLRAEGETRWKLLKPQLWDALLTWDTTSVPDGTYSVKVVATDASGNEPGSALRGEMESTSFVIDNTSPRVEVTSSATEGARTVLLFEVRDNHSAIQRVEYSADAVRWRTVFPRDGMADSRVESFRVVLDEGVKPEDVTIRAFDALNNVATGAGAVPPRPAARR